MFRTSEWVLEWMMTCTRNCMNLWNFIIKNNISFILSYMIPGYKLTDEILSLPCTFIIPFNSAI